MQPRTLGCWLAGGNSVVDMGAAFFSVFSVHQMSQNFSTSIGIVPGTHVAIMLELERNAFFQDFPSIS